MNKLTPKQEKFCILFAKYGDGTKAYIEAYNCKNKVTARTNAHKNLQKPIIKAFLDELMKGSKENSIASANEVLEYLSKVMRGEEKDQFGLEVSIQDRTKAADLLLKRYKAFDKEIDEKMEELKRKQIELDIKKREIEIERIANGDGDIKTISALDRLEEALNEDD